MKKLILLVLLACQIAVQAQTVEPAPADKAVVYFVRASSLGALINFTYFDNTQVIGRFNGPKYLRYECEPGTHLFWARSENRDFVEAELEAGKIYVIDVIPMMGALKAAVQLKPVPPAAYKMKKIQKLLNRQATESFTEAELAKLEENVQGIVDRGMERYGKEAEEVKKLNADMSFQPEQLAYVKKKKA